MSIFNLSARGHTPDGETLYQWDKGEYHHTEYWMPLRGGGVVYTRTEAVPVRSNERAYASVAYMRTRVDCYPVPVLTSYRIGRRSLHVCFSY